MLLSWNLELRHMGRFVRHLDATFYRQENTATRRHKNFIQDGSWFTHRKLLLPAWTVRAQLKAANYLISQH